MSKRASNDNNLKRRGLSPYKHGGVSTIGDISPKQRKRELGSKAKLQRGLNSRRGNLSRFETILVNFQRPNL